MNLAIESGDESALRVMLAIVQQQQADCEAKLCELRACHTTLARMLERHGADLGTIPRVASSAPPRVVKSGASLSDLVEAVVLSERRLWSVGEIQDRLPSSEFNARLTDPYKTIYSLLSSRAKQGRIRRYGRGQFGAPDLTIAPTAA